MIFFFSFRGSFRAKLLKLLVKSEIKYQFNYKKHSNIHQVKKYTNFVNNSLNIKLPAGKLVIYKKNNSIQKNNKLIGINPGASYGNAKRWYPDKFAEVAIKLSDTFDFIIFGGPDEKAFASEIEQIFIRKKIKNFQNLAGKTSIEELINNISILDILITGDSGPMHIAASLEIPTIALFGPTDDKETSQWMNPKSIIIKKNLECQPCLEKNCPLKHHNCMKLIETNEVVQNVSLILNKN